MTNKKLPILVPLSVLCSKFSQDPGLPYLLDIIQVHSYILMKANKESVLERPGAQWFLWSFPIPVMPVRGTCCTGSRAGEGWPLVLFIAKEAAWGSVVCPQRPGRNSTGALPFAGQISPVCSPCQGVPRLH